MYLMHKGTISSRFPSALTYLIAAPLLILLSIPLCTLIGHLSALSWLWQLEADHTALSALTLSIKTSSLSTLLTLVMGTPLAWLLAKSQKRRASVIQVLILVPMFLPPSIVGLTLLSALSSNGWLIRIFPMLNELAFSTEAVIIAQLVVSAPLYVMGATAVFRRLSPQLIEIARTLGAHPFEAWRRVTLPIMLPGLLLALSLSWARSVGEFGATLLFAGHLPNITQTAPLAIYLELERGTTGALALSLALIGYMLPIFLGAMWFGKPK